jgi:hypothetical protein
MSYVFVDCDNFKFLFIKIKIHVVTRIKYIKKKKILNTLIIKIYNILYQ